MRSTPSTRLSALLALAALTACSEQQDTPPLSKFSGVFLDSPVAGIGYGRGDRTNAHGEFRYAPESTLEFFVGDISLGSAKGADVLSPVQLTPGANDETHFGVVNRARFLQTIDEDANVENGIQIPSELHERALGLDIDFDQSSTEFEAEADVALTVFASILGGPRELVAASDAQAHLASSLRNANAGHYGGAWKRTEEIEGEQVEVELGRWEIVVTRAGQVGGWAFGTDAEEPESLNGSVTTGGSVVFTGSTSNGAFQGNLANCAMSGPWTNFVDPPGSFAGECLTPSDLFIGELPEEMLGLYTGSYVGAGAVEQPVSVELMPTGDLSLAEPFGRGTIVHVRSNGAAEFIVVSVEGTRITGLVTPEGEMEATAMNDEGEIDFRLTIDG